jgi:hypothetical protein
LKYRIPFGGSILLLLACGAMAAAAAPLDPAGEQPPLEKESALEESDDPKRGASAVDRIARIRAGIEADRVKLEGLRQDLESR